MLREGPLFLRQGKEEPHPIYLAFLCWDIVARSAEVLVRFGMLYKGENNNDLADPDGFAGNTKIIGMIKQGQRKDEMGTIPYILHVIL